MFQNLSVQRWPGSALAAAHFGQLAGWQARQNASQGNTR